MLCRSVWLLPEENVKRRRETAVYWRKEETVGVFVCNKPTYRKSVYTNNSPVLLRRPVALSAVLEPVADLREREAGAPGQVALLVRRRVPVLQIAVLQGRPRLLLETVHRLLAVPDGLRQRVLLAQPVLVDGAQRPAADLLRLAVVRLEPQLLQLRVVSRVEALALQYGVQLVERVPAAPRKNTLYRGGLGTCAWAC